MTWTVSDVMSKDVTTVGFAGESMTADVVTTTASTPLATAASLMFQHHAKVLPVVDAENRLVGIVSRSRLLKVFVRSDESIRREIGREYIHGMPLLGCGKLEAEVKDGVVHLYGDVGEGSLTGLLMRLVAAVPGVVGVESHLETKDARQIGSSRAEGATGRAKVESTASDSSAGV
jgi:predicted transcriptional regulator